MRAILALATPTFRVGTSPVWGSMTRPFSITISYFSANAGCARNSAKSKNDLYMAEDHTPPSLLTGKYSGLAWLVIASFKVRVWMTFRRRLSPCNSRGQLCATAGSHFFKEPEPWGLLGC